MTRNQDTDAGRAIATVAVGALFVKLVGWLGRWVLIAGAIAGIVWLVRRVFGGTSAERPSLEGDEARRAAGMSLAP